MQSLPSGDFDFVQALTGGGDSRLAVDRLTGVNRYLVPPRPDEEGICFSSCTASPISPAGYRAAKRCFADLTAERSGTNVEERFARWETEVISQLGAHLGTSGLADIVLLPSGTDGLLLCAILLAMETGDHPLTAILPAASETGTGVPLASIRQAFDQANAAAAGTVQIALRTPDGAPRDEDAMNADFARAVRRARGRAVITLTYGTKTGLVAPLMVPDGVDVVVDACQLRLSPAIIRDCLRKGWPVVVTGSKYLGGPPFSGAVLLPSGRFRGMREPALASWRRIVVPAEADAPSVGPLLRWIAATEGLGDAGDEAPRPMPPIAAAMDALSDVRGLRFIAGPTQAMNDAAGACPGILCFAVRDPLLRGAFLPAERLRVLHRSLADRGILLGQPTDVGPFGVLRLAFGRRDTKRVNWQQDLDRVAGELREMLDRLASPRVVHDGQRGTRRVVEPTVG